MISKFLITVFICLFCYPCYASELMSKEAIKHFNEGVRAQMEGDYRNAQTNYQRALIIDKGTICKKFILNNLGLIYIKDGDMYSAELAFKEALKIDPNYNVASLNLALLYLKLAIHYKEQGDSQKALDNLEKAFQFHSDKAFIIEKEQDIKEDNY